MIFEVDGDIFMAPQKSALMHCVSTDGAMSHEIAGEFVKRYPELKLLRKQTKNVGSTIPLACSGRTIYNLCTKKQCGDKPDVSALQDCLLSVREHALLAGIKDISLARTGTGLNELNYMDQVLPSLKMAFKNSDINIWVYSLKGSPDDE